MLVLTIDQVDSRGRGDRVAALLPELADRWGPRILLGPDRTAGDEFQIVVAAADAALGIVLELTRTGGWSVGLGVGEVDDPLPATTREAVGGAFVAARAAVDRSKRAQHRFALETDREAAREEAGDVEALTDLLLEVRARRSAEGWAVADRLGGGATPGAGAREL